MIVVIMPLDGATIAALLSFPFPSLSAAVNKVDLGNWSQALEVNADEISYTSAGQTFVCLENNKLRSFKCSSVFGTEGSAHVWSL